MNIKKIETLYAFMSKVKEENFDFGRFVHECGTICCVAGYLPKVFPKHFAYSTWYINDKKFNDRIYSPKGDVVGTEYYAEFFECEHDAIESLFYPNIINSWFGGVHLSIRASLKDWLKNCKLMIKYFKKHQQ